MTKDYESGFNDGVIKGIIKFAKFLKENSCFYDLDNYHSFRAVDMDDLDDLIDEFLIYKG